MHIIKVNLKKHIHLKLQNTFILFSSMHVGNFEVGESVFIYQTISSGKHEFAGLVVHGIVIEKDNAAALNQKYNQEYPNVGEGLGIVIQNLNPSTIEIKSPIVPLTVIKKSFRTQDPEFLNILGSQCNSFKINSLSDQDRLKKLWQEAKPREEHKDLSSHYIPKESHREIDFANPPKKIKKEVDIADLNDDIKIPVINRSAIDFFKQRKVKHSRTAASSQPENIQEIGHYGEWLVYRYFLKYYLNKNPEQIIITDEKNYVLIGRINNKSSYVRIDWYNKPYYKTDQYTKKNHDIKITKMSKNSINKRYIEVKTTTKTDSEFSSITFFSSELALMRKQKSNYHLYRVFGVGRAEADLTIYKVQDIDKMFVSNIDDEVNLELTCFCPSRK